MSGDLLTTGQPPSVTETADDARARASRRLPWVAGAAVAVVALFACYLRMASSVQLDSDGAANALQAWDMLHGNLLLHGWRLSDVSFYTTELPEYMLVEAVRGLRPDVAHICAALTYTLLVVLAALVARGRATGREGLVRALLAAGIMLAPQQGETVGVLLAVPDHTGTAVPVLLVLLLIDRAGQRWYVPVLTGAVLAWALVADSLVLLIGVVPLAVVCLLRACQGLIRHREPLASRWFELSLAAASLVSVEVASIATHLIRSSGGWVIAPGAKAFVRSGAMPVNLSATFEDFLTLFGADFFGERFGRDVVFTVVHLAAAGLVVAALWLAIRGFFRAGDLVSGILAAAIVVNLLAYMVIFRASTVTAREIAPVLSLGAALVGRTLAGPLIRNRMEPVLAIGLACFVFALAPALIKPVSPPGSAGLTSWLEGHHLDSGVAGYWETNSVRLDSDGRVTIAPVTVGAGRHLVPYHWESNLSWFNPGTHYADFLVTSGPSARGPSDVSEREALRTFGKPARIYHYHRYTIMVWHENLLRVLDRR